MCGFTDLPTEVQAAVCTIWLKLKDVTHLDSALCNSSRRSDFLSLIETKCLFHYIPKDEDSTFAQSWMILRSIRTTTIHARTKDPEMYYDSDQEIMVEKERSADLRLCGDMLRVSGSVVKTLRLLYFDAQILQYVRTYCTHLTSFQIDECTVDENLWYIIGNNKLIKELHLSGCRGDRSILYGPSMPAALAGTNLLKLLISGSLVHDQAFVKITSCTPNLRSLDISAGQFSNAALIKVSEQCRRITNLTLYNHSLDDATFVTVLSNLACIQTITITHTSITNASLIALVSMHGRHLISMKLHVGVRLTEADTVRLLSGCTQLRTLALHHLQPFDMPTVIHTADLSRLTSLNVGTDWNTGVLRAVARSCPQLRSFGCRFANQPHAIMPELRLIVQLCTHLQSFFLGFTLDDPQFIALKTEKSSLWRIDEDFPEFNVMTMPT